MARGRPEPAPPAASKQKKGSKQSQKAAGAKADAPQTIKEEDTPPQPTPEMRLQELKEKKKQSTEQLKDVERQIYDLETRYLDSASPLGNALRGYQGLLAHSSSNKNEQPLTDEDRLFSNSSLTGRNHLGRNK